MRTEWVSSVLLRRYFQTCGDSQRLHACKEPELCNYDHLVRDWYAWSVGRWNEWLTYYDLEKVNKKIKQTVEQLIWRWDLKGHYLKSQLTLHKRSIILQQQQIWRCPRILQKSAEYLRKSQRQIFNWLRQHSWLHWFSVWHSGQTKLSPRLLHKSAEYQRNSQRQKFIRLR
jgi:hypothetical protein